VAFTNHRHPWSPSPLSAAPRTMKRIELIPNVTTDGRHIIYTAIPLTPRERAKRLAGKLRPKRKRDS
jgi:hypothetical protein